MTRVHSTRPATVYWSRRFAIDAGREVAKREMADLLVYDDAGGMDFRISYSKRATRWRWSPRRLAATPVTDAPLDHAPTTSAHLVEVELPYDSWCLRTARSESAKALTGLCRPDVLDELLLVITELVLQSTVHSRSECTLSVHRVDNEVLIVVRDQLARSTTERRDVGAIGSGLGSMHATTTEYGVDRTAGQRCVWARFNLRGESSSSA